MRQYWTKYNIPQWNAVKGMRFRDGRREKVYYYKNRFSLDTETSSWFFVDGEWSTAKYLGYDDIKRATDMHSEVYEWTCTIDGETVYGRTIEELHEFLDKFNKVNPCLKFLYVQNLGYDFSFISEVLPEGKGMYAAKYKPYYYEIPGYELRDLLVLTGYSLATLANTYGLTSKLTGDLDYTDNITHITALTDKELEYCFTDTEIIDQYLQILYRQYDPLKVPMTATGMVRREVKKIMRKYKDVMHALRPDYNFFDVLTKTYFGGVTHCSNLYSNQKQYDVTSADRASSYPTEMCCSDHFPLTVFASVPPSQFDIRDMTKCTIMHVKFKGMKCRSSWEYLSAHKAQHMLNEIVDNGRLFAADEADYYLTDVDLRLILKGYHVDDYEITECYQAKAGYLPVEFVDYILTNYGNKTSLKNVAGREDEYRHSKQIINGMYGMTVTSPVHSAIDFDGVSGEWTERQLTVEEMSQILDEDKPFLYYPWGIYVTALARYELFTPIYGMDGVDPILDDVVYVDTDSIKYVNDHGKSVGQYNIRMMKRIEAASKHFGIPMERFMPTDPKGNQHPLGLFEIEGTYDEFLSMGAKKYCVMEDGKFGFTVAGLKKSYVDGTGKHPTMTSMDQMKIGSAIPHARTSSIYSQDMTPCEVVDRDGNSVLLTNKRGIIMYNSPYTFGLSDDYEALLSVSRAQGKLNGPTDILATLIADAIRNERRKDNEE